MKQKHKKIWEEYEPRDYLRDHDIDTLLFFEQQGFGDVKISQVIDEFIEYLQFNRGLRGKKD